MVLELKVMEYRISLGSHVTGEPVNIFKRSRGLCVARELDSGPRRQHYVRKPHRRRGLTHIGDAGFFVSKFASPM